MRWLGLVKGRGRSLVAGIDVTHCCGPCPSGTGCVAAAVSAAAVAGSTGDLTVVSTPCAEDRDTWVVAMGCTSNVDRRLRCLPLVWAGGRTCWCLSPVETPGTATAPAPCATNVPFPCARAMAALGVLWCCRGDTRVGRCDAGRWATLAGPASAVPRRCRCRCLCLGRTCCLGLPVDVVPPPPRSEWARGR